MADKEKEILEEMPEVEIPEEEISEEATEETAAEQETTVEEASEEKAAEEKKGFGKGKKKDKNKKMFFARKTSDGTYRIFEEYLPDKQIILNPENISILNSFINSGVCPLYNMH